ncbi:MAG: hypothetical protein AAF581_19250 [Planctomycetota bacterium]
MKGSVVVVISALMMVLVYVLTVSLLGSDADRVVLFMSGDSMAASDPFLVHRYLGFTAIIIAALHAIYFGYRWWISPGRLRRSRWDYARRASERYTKNQPKGTATQNAAAATQAAPETSSSATNASGGVDGTAQLESNVPAAPHLHVLEMNQEVDVFLDGNDGECARGMLVHKDGGHLVVRILDHDSVAGWPAGASLQVYFWRANDSGYVFESKIIENRQIGTAYLVLTIPTSFEKKQRRMYVRASHRERVTFLHVPSGQATQWLGGADSDQNCLHEGMVEDLSAGGFRMITDADLGNGDYISIDNFTPIGGEILARVSANLGGVDGKGFGRYGLQYVGVDSATRDRITQAVFRLHRQMLSERSEQRANETTGQEQSSP